ncbi:MAG TPA: DNA repair protein RadC [Oscillospiraceae bacterium]|nr:DNA repair protein RadC [Oscillospiraceae bacterium]
MHEGHRERIKEKFLKNGIDNFEPHEVLELLLYSAIPRKDTNVIAHNLLDRFDSISGIFDAPYEELLKVDGIGQSAATLIKLVPPISRCYLDDKQQDKARIYNTETAGKMLQQKFIGRTNEVVVLLLLDSKSRQLFCGVVNEGSVNTVPIYVRKIVELAVRYNAASAILSHNHPSGNTMPSAGDITATKDVFHALETVNVHLSDHIIIIDGDYLSLADSGLLKNLFG